jgi:hypothetical protein
VPSGHALTRVSVTCSRTGRDGAVRGSPSIRSQPPRTAPRLRPVRGVVVRLHWKAAWRENATVGPHPAGMGLLCFREWGRSFCNSSYDQTCHKAHVRCGGRALALFSSRATVRDDRPPPLLLPRRGSLRPPSAHQRRWQRPDERDRSRRSGQRIWRQRVCLVSRFQGQSVRHRSGGLTVASAWADNRGEAEEP